MLYALLSLAIFITMQLLGEMGARLYCATNAQLEIDAERLTALPPTEVRLVSFMISLLLTIGILWATKLIRQPLVPRLPLSQPRRLVWRGSGWLILGYVLTEKCVTLSIEMLGVPNLLQAEFEAMMAYPLLMVVALCLIGPLAEELVFREGILRHLHVWRANKWWAVVLSALCFGLVHINPAQIVSATLLGLLLGWVYVRTGDVRLSVALHILNNLFAFALGYAVLHWGWPDTLQAMLSLPLPPLPWWGDVLYLSGMLLLLSSGALYALYRWTKVATPMPEREYFTT